MLKISQRFADIAVAFFTPGGLVHSAICALSIGSDMNEFLYSVFRVSCAVFTLFFHFILSCSFTVFHHIWYVLDSIHVPSVT